MLRIENYFARIGWTGGRERSREALWKLHFLHATRIPFENLDIQLNVPVSLALEALQRKLVDNLRGGYCFEQNTLFGAVLEELGFSFIACEARVRMGRPGLNPRTHMLLVVETDEGRCICDVGFGGEGLLHPVFLDGRISEQFLWTYRVVTEGPQHVLQSKRQSDWMDLYAFLPQPCAPVDFEVANWFTSTHPESRFVQILTAQLPTPEARHILRNRTYVIQRGSSEDTREIGSLDELLTILKLVFQLEMPSDTRFRNPVF